MTGRPVRFDAVGHSVGGEAVFVVQVDHRGDLHLRVTTPPRTFDFKLDPAQADALGKALSASAGLPRVV